MKITSLCLSKESIDPNSVPSREAIFAAGERNHISARNLNELGSSVVFHAYKPDSYGDEEKFLRSILWGPPLDQHRFGLVSGSTRAASKTTSNIGESSSRLRYENACIGPEYSVRS